MKKSFRKIQKKLSNIYQIISKFLILLKPVVAQWHKHVTKTVNARGCGGNEIFRIIALVSKQSTALSSATQHAMPPEFGCKWVTECLTLSSLSATRRIQREAEKKNYLYQFCEVR